MKMRALSCGVTLALLSACGGSDNGVGVATVPPPATAPTPAPVTDVPNIVGAKPFLGGLQQAGEESVGLFLKNGLYSRSSELALPLLETTSDAARSSSAGNFSTTNTQESGVDEADRIEYDGDFMYVAQYPQWQENELQGGALSAPMIRILQRNPDFSLTQVAQVNTSLEQGNITGMYLHQDRLSVLSGGYPIVTLAAATSLPFGFAAGQIQLDIVDTHEPAAAAVVATVAIDGSLISSRRIDEQLYIVSAHNPYIDNLPLPTPEGDNAGEIYNEILQTPTQSLMPNVAINGVTQALHQPQDCFIPEQAGAEDGFAQLISITRVNMQQPEDMESLCLATLGDFIYMSSHNLYLLSRVGEQTGIHKVALQDGLSYAASGAVTGVLGGFGKGALRVSEQAEFLRLVTSDYQNESPQHQLHVLSQSGNVLTQVAQLPNESQSEAIGKPGEDIFAVRFIEDKAYIVTFETIDPLYVVELSDNRQPQIAGALEIPGFSSYLQPLNNGYLLGVGQEVEVGEPGPDGSPSRVQTSGMKVSLFDVNDPAAPTEVSTLVLDNSYTPVEYDYRALSVLSTETGYRVAMPVEQWPEFDPDDISTTVFDPNHSLLMLQVNTESDNAGLTQVQRLNVGNSEQRYVYSGEDRSVLHNDNVFYLHGNQLWHTLWQADAAVNGPY